MRYLILSLLFFSTSVLAWDADVNCYSNGIQIYSGRVKDMIYDDAIFTFIDKKTNKLVFVQAECVVKLL